MRKIKLSEENVLTIISELLPIKRSLECKVAVTKRYSQELDAESVRRLSDVNEVIEVLSKSID